MSRATFHPQTRVVGLLVAMLALCHALWPAGAAAEAKGAAAGKAFLWQLERDGRTAYLLGSFHLASKDMYPLPPQVEAAFARSSVLVVEARVDRVSPTLQAQILQRGMYMPPDGLDQHVSADTWRLTVQAAKPLGLPEAVVRQMRPWMAATSISVMAIKGIGFDEQRGVEMHFLGQAGSRTVEELEGAMAQIDLLAGFSDKEQEAFLVYSIKQARSVKSEIRRLVTAWKRGDARAMQRVLTAAVKQTPRLRSMYKRLVPDRNKTMAAKLDQLISATAPGQPCFAIVGAAHLVGDDGIVALMRAKGYRATQR